MIKFRVLAIKADTDKLHAIFLLKKNVWSNIIKTRLGYLPITVLETLKEQKVVITSVGQGYKSIEERHNYKTSTKIIYNRREQLMDIRKSNNNFKDEKPNGFNCNKYSYMAKEC